MQGIEQIVPLKRLIPLEGHNKYKIIVESNTNYCMILKHDLNGYFIDQKFE